MQDPEPGRFETRCPQCGMISAELVERCPGCGLDLGKVYSGTYIPADTPPRRVLSVVLLATMFAGLLAGLLIILAG
jgi:uncharacterized protein (DUF983 family)